MSVWTRILVYFLAAMLFLTFVSRFADSIMLPAVICARPMPGALSHTVALEGDIEAKEVLPIMPERGLIIAQVYVRANQSVKAGDVLLSYDMERLLSELENKQSELRRLTLQAQLDAISYQDERSELRRQLSKLEIDAAQSEVDRLSQLIYGGAVLIAPVDGHVSEVLVQPGDTALGAAFRLAPASSGLIVRCIATEEQAKHLRSGMEARFRLSGDVKTAVLVSVAPAGMGYEAIFELPDNKGAIGQSISLTATHTTETYNMRVPLGAVVDKGGMKGVYRIRAGQSVLGDMEYAEFVAVTILETDMQYAAIQASLTEQEQVIVSSNKPLSAGDRVRFA